MKLVQRGNKQLRVEDGLLPGMLAVGYVELDQKTGKPLTVPAPKDSAAALKKENDALKKECRDVKEQIKALKKENENLKEQIEVLTVQISALNNPSEDL